MSHLFCLREYSLEDLIHSGNHLNSSVSLERNVIITGINVGQVLVVWCFYFLF